MSIIKIVVKDVQTHEEVDVEYTDYTTVRIGGEDGINLNLKDLFSSVNLLEAAYYAEHGMPDRGEGPEDAYADEVNQPLTPSTIGNFTPGAPPAESMGQGLHGT